MLEIVPSRKYGTMRIKMLNHAQEDTISADYCSFFDFMYTKCYNGCAIFA